MNRGDSVGIVGAGRFGTSLANLIAKSGGSVIVWSRTAEVVEDINQNHRNTKRLPDLELAPELVATSDPAELAARARLIVIAVSAVDVESRARILGGVVDGSHLLVHGVGGLSEGNDMRVSELLLAETPVLRVGALAGPALPGDLNHGRYASMVAASRYDEVTNETRRLLGVPPVLRIYRSRDLIGVEIAAALAGAYTVAMGMADGLQTGAGPRAVLITRAVAEATRFAVAAGAEARTFAGLAGLGNLLVRSSAPSSADSRAYQLGLALGRGEAAPGRSAFAGRVAESAMRMAQRLGVRVPVLRGVTAIIAGKLTAHQAAAAMADSVADEE